MLSRRLSIVSFRFLMFVMGVSAIFVHLVSPLRDPAFQPNSGNAGTLIRELQGVSEAHWIQAASILAALLAVNFMLVIWEQRIERRIASLVILGLVMWWLLDYVFMFYLVVQWIVD